MPRKPLEPGDPRHGTANGYTNYGCKCIPCREAWNVAVAQKREKRRSRDIPEGVVHNNSTYLNWGCKCIDCTADHAKKAQEDRERRRTT